MVPAFLYYFRVLFPVLGDANPYEGICAGDTLSKRCPQDSSQGHDSGSNRPDLVSCKHSRSAEASRDWLARQATAVEDVVRPLAAWHSFLFGSRCIMLDRRSRYVASSLLTIGETTI